MGILRLDEQEVDINSSVYIFQQSPDDPHIIGLKEPELAKILSILVGLLTISSVCIIGDLVQVKYRIGKETDKTLEDNQRLGIIPASQTSPYLNVRNIGEVHMLARKFMHTSHTPIAGK